MGLFRFFFKKNPPPPPVLLRCSRCRFEYELSLREVRLLEQYNAQDPLCPVKEECHICHTGFMIPVNYTNPAGKTFRYHELKPKIKELDPNTLMERIFLHPDSVPLDDDI